MSGDVTNAIERERSRFGARFKEHAAPEAVDAALADAQTAQRRLAAHIAWLEDVRVTAIIRRRASSTETESR